MRQLKIKKGNRYPNCLDAFLPIVLLKGSIFRRDFIVKFDKSAIYQFDNEDQHDINKLFGFSIGAHHNTSFRFGWRPTANLRHIEILTYEYQDSKRISVPLVELDLDKWYRMRIEIDLKRRTVKYLVIGMVDHKYDIYSHTSFLKKSPRIAIGYTLGMYFGGNKTAPHDIIISKINCLFAKNKL